MFGVVLVLVLVWVVAHVGTDVAGWERYNRHGLYGRFIGLDLRHIGGVGDVGAATGLAVPVISCGYIRSIGFGASMY